MCFEITTHFGTHFRFIWSIISLTRPRITIKYSIISFVLESWKEWVFDAKANFEFYSCIDAWKRYYFVENGIIIESKSFDSNAIIQCWMLKHRRENVWRELVEMLISICTRFQCDLCSFVCYFFGNVPKTSYLDFNVLHSRHQIAHIEPFDSCASPLFFRTVLIVNYINFKNRTFFGLWFRFNWKFQFWSEIQVYIIFAWTDNEDESSISINEFLFIGFTIYNIIQCLKRSD